MYDKSQMMRGTLEGCILKIISIETTYGYEIVMKLLNFALPLLAPAGNIIRLPKREKGCWKNLKRAGEVYRIR